MLNIKQPNNKKKLMEKLNFKQNGIYYGIGGLLALLIIFGVCMFFFGKSNVSQTKENQSLDKQNSLEKQEKNIKESSNQQLKDELKDIIIRMLKECKCLELDFEKINFQNIKDLTNYQKSNEFDKLLVIFDKLKNLGEQVQQNCIRIKLGKLDIIFSIDKKRISIQSKNNMEAVTFDENGDFSIAIDNFDTMISFNRFCLDQSNEILFPNGDNGCINIMKNGSGPVYKKEQILFKKDEIKIIMEKWFPQIKQKLNPRIDKIITDLS